MKNGGQSNIELPAECKEPKLPTIMVSFNGIHLALEEENQIKAKKQVKFSKESSEPNAARSSTSFHLRQRSGR